MTRLLGVHEAKPAGRRFGAAQWGREFVAGYGGAPLPESTTEQQLIDKVLRKVRPHAQADGGAMVSIKLPLLDVMWGRWDSRLQALGANIDPATTELIINHEPENDTGDIPVGIFVTGFNRAADQLHTRNADLFVNYAAMAYQWAPRRASTRYPGLWAEELRADRYLADVYVGKTWPQRTALKDHPGLRRFLDEMVLPYGRPTGLAEYGRLKHRLRPEMFHRDFHWLATDEVGRLLADVVLVWNTGGTEGNSGWVLDEAAETEVREGLQLLEGMS